MKLGVANGFEREVGSGQCYDATAVASVYIGLVGG